MAPAHDLSAGLRGALEHLERREPDEVDEEQQLLGVVAVGIPGEAVIAPHPQPAAGAENPPGALGPAVERLLVAVDDPLREAELGAALHAHFLEVQRRHAGNVAGEKELEPLIVDERAMLDRVIARLERIRDPLGGPAVAGHFETVVVGGGHHGAHLLERHAKGVVIVDVGGGGVAGGVGLHPLDAILDELPDRGAGLVGAVDEEHEPLHADTAEVGIPVHQPADAADLTAAGHKPGARREVVLDGFLEPDIDIEQAPATAGRRVAALEGQPGVGGGEERDVFDRILDVEILEGRDVEVGGMEVGLDKAGHDRPAADIDPPRALRLRWHRGLRTGIGHDAVADHERRISHRRGSRAVEQPAAADHRRACFVPHVFPSKKVAAPHPGPPDASPPAKSLRLPRRIAKRERFEERDHQPRHEVGLLADGVVADPWKVDRGRIGKRLAEPSEVAVGEHAATRRIGPEQEHRAGDAAERRLPVDPFEPGIGQQREHRCWVEVLQARRRKPDIRQIARGAERRRRYPRGAGEGGDRELPGELANREWAAGVIVVEREHRRIGAAVDRGQKRRPRRIFEDDSRDRIGAGRGDKQGDEGSEGVAVENWPVEAPHDPHGIGRIVADEIPSAPLRLAMPALVVGPDAKPGEEPGEERGERRPAARHSMEEEERRLGGISRRPSRQRDTIAVKRRRREHGAHSVVARRHPRIVSGLGRGPRIDLPRFFFRRPSPTSRPPGPNTASMYSSTCSAVSKY